MGRRAGRRAFLALAAAGLAARPALAQGGRVTLCSWPGQHDPGVLAAFSGETGIAVRLVEVASEGEMTALLREAPAAFDLLVAGDGSLAELAAAGLLQPLGLPAPEAVDPRLLAVAPGYGLPCAWGTAGIVHRLQHDPESWVDFFRLAALEASGQLVLPDDPVVTPGAALLAAGRPFGSRDPEDLAAADAVLRGAFRHLFAVTSDPLGALLAGDARLALCWSPDARRLVERAPAFRYVLPPEGGQLWSLSYALPAAAPQPEAARALLSFLLRPENDAAACLTHRLATPWAATRRLLPGAVAEDPVVYPPPDAFAAYAVPPPDLARDPARIALVARLLAG